MTDLLTVDETASLLRCHNSTIYRKLERGEWGGFAWKVGKDWRIEKAALLKHLRTQPVQRRSQETDPMPSRRARFAETMARGRSAA